MTAARPVRCPRSLVVWLCVLFVSTGIAPAFADAMSAGSDVSIAQTLGDRELTIVLRRVTAVPGPLRVDIVTHTGSPEGRVILEVAPTGAAHESPAAPAPGASTARADVDLGRSPGMYSATVPVDRAGPWELAVGDGVRVARIPFLVAEQVTAPPERLVYGGFLTAGLLLLVSVLVAVRARRTVWALLPASGVVAAVAVAVTAAVLSAALPLPPQPGIALDPTMDNVADPYSLNQPLIADFSRPPAMLVVEGDPLIAGQPGDLGLGLIDGATGAPVDDLLIHDSALMHLLVIGPTGELEHLHPIRTGPGHYQVHLAAPQPGRYALSAELVRRGGGVQMVRAATGFMVSAGESAGVSPAAPQALIHLDGATTTGSMMMGDTLVTATTTPPTAAAPVTITVAIGDTADLQPWLGMVGHLIVAGPLSAAGSADAAAAVPNSPVWGHAHSMGAMPSPGLRDMPPGSHTMPGMHGTGSVPRGTAHADTTMSRMLMPPVNGESAPDETVAAYGPDVPFTYTFPMAGSYRLWIQVERHYTILTVPVLLDIGADSTRGPGR
ncbi:hypothetical protein AB0B25_23810 [Nocardia sp. NPDC049190]|uniref:hypothetical protein n=1 Tax=Nocardia sp. NPDC049190 TaxID=3155650 RepID=UPI0033F14094